jgi:hypothetical protein
LPRAYGREVDRPHPSGTRPLSTVAENYHHVWCWRSKLPERKGSPCRVVARSRRLGSVLVEFEDGVRVVTSRYAVRLK